MFQGAEGALRRSGDARICKGCMINAAPSARPPPLNPSSHLKGYHLDFFGAGGRLSASKTPGDCCVVQFGMAAVLLREQFRSQRRSRLCNTCAAQSNRQNTAPDQPPQVVRRSGALAQALVVKALWAMPQRPHLPESRHPKGMVRRSPLLWSQDLSLPRFLVSLPRAVVPPLSWVRANVHTLRLAHMPLPPLLSLSDHMAFAQVFNPYNVQVVSHSAVRPGHYLTMSAKGVTVYCNGESDFTSLQRWQREHAIFKNMVRIPFFDQFRIWKTFYFWRRFIRYYAPHFTQVITQPIATTHHRQIAHTHPLWAGALRLGNAPTSPHRSCRRNQCFA